MNKVLVSGLAVLTADNFDFFVYGHDEVVLFFSNNPALFPESHDVAVILPELLKRFAGRLHAALIDTTIERELQARFRFTSWPSLVFLRRGEYLGTITGIQDWSGFCAEFERILALSPSEPPAFNLASACQGVA